MAGDLEERSVSKDEIKQGVVLRAGHEVVLIVDGLQGTPRPAPKTDGPQDEPEEPQEPQPAPQNQQPNPEPKPPPDVTPSVLASFDTAHFETAKAFPLDESLEVFRAVAARIAQE